MEVFKHVSALNHNCMSQCLKDSEQENVVLQYSILNTLVHVKTYIKQLQVMVKSSMQSRIIKCKYWYVKEYPRVSPRDSDGKINIIYAISRHACVITYI